MHVWLTKLTLSWHLHALNTYVFFNFCQVTQSKLVCDTQWAARKLAFVCCTWAIFCALHTTHTSCATCKMVRSTQVILHMQHASWSSLLLYCTQVKSYPLPEKSQGIRLQWNGMLAKCNETCGYTENSILSSIYLRLFQSTLDDIVSNTIRTCYITKCT